MSTTLHEATQLKTLWTDAPDAMEQLHRTAAGGLIGTSMRGALAHFIEHGWLTMPGAIEPELIDQFVDDVRSLHRHPGKFVRTDHRNGGASLQLTGKSPDHFESLLDLYVNLESSCRVCMHACVTEFLIAVFRTRPLAFQQLLFQRSNGHLFHQDTAYVAVEEPLFLVATWIALEDVVEGSGELAYYDASHKLPHVLFKGGTKRFISRPTISTSTRSSSMRCVGKETLDTSGSWRRKAMYSSGQRISCIAVIRACFPRRPAGCHA